MTALLRYDAARSALAEARSVDEVKDIRNRAEAMRAYGRIAKDRQMEVDAAEIRIRAERRLGEMLATAKAAGDLSRGRPQTRRRAQKFALREAGIEKGLSARAQRFAAVPTEEFERQLFGWRQHALEANRRVPRGLSPDPNIVGPSRRRHVDSCVAIVSGCDIRNWSVANLRRAAALIPAIAQHCGGADPTARVGDCISDAVIEALAQQ